MPKFFSQVNPRVNLLTASLVTDSTCFKVLYLRLWPLHLRQVVRSKQMALQANAEELMLESIASGIRMAYPIRRYP